MFSQDWCTTSEWGSKAFASVSSPVVAAETSGITIKKYDDEQQLVYGEVYAPSIPDSQGDYMSATGTDLFKSALLSCGRPPTEAAHRPYARPAAVA